MPSPAYPRAPGFGSYCLPLAAGAHTGFGSYASFETTRAVWQTWHTTRKVNTFSVASYRDVVSCRWSHMRVKVTGVEAESLRAGTVSAGRVDAGCVVLTIERCAVARKGQGTMLTGGLGPVLVRIANLLARLSPAHPTFNRFVDE